MIEETVGKEMTAAAVGSGDVFVLATPVILSFVERAAVEAVRGHLPPGTTSVGVSAALAHLAPSPIGANVRVHVELDQVDGRRLRFRCSAWDAAGEVANGTHVRVVVDRDTFEAGAAARAGPGTSSGT
jgi:fluoroacetyl-CoA thioesterase